MKNQYHEFALLVNEKIGLNVVPVRGKRATVAWSKWQTEKQTEEDISRMDWEGATGFASIMGDGIMVLDFDQLYDGEIIESCLKTLGLDKDYEWVVQTGSGHGIHIYFYCAEMEKVFELLGAKKGVYSFKCLEGIECDHIELRIGGCYCVMPPSLHEAGGRYNYKNNEPGMRPSEVNAENIVEAVKALCEVERVSKDNTLNENKNIQSYYDDDEISEIAELLSKKLKKGSYGEWLNIGFALTTLSEKGEDIFVEMSLKNPEYSDTEAEVRNKFRQLEETANGNITMGTFYHIAEKYGWKRPKVKIWCGERGKLKILKSRVKRLLENEGFCKTRIGTKKCYVRRENNILSEFDITDVKDLAMCYVEELTIEEMEGLTREAILNLVMNSNNQVFTEGFLEFLTTKELQFKEDTEESSYLFFKNQFIEVTAEGVYASTYELLDKCIWKNEILNREYHGKKNRGMFEDFCFNAMGRDVSRLNSLKSAIGKTLHRYKSRSEAKAVVFTDEVISEGASGRSGKGLTVNGIEHIRKTMVIEGKNFSPAKSFAFQRLTNDTNVLAFQDLDKGFPFDKLFSIITDGITIERKNKDEIYLSFERSPNLIITTNNILNGLDESSLDRQFVVEFSGHYHLRHRPIHEFGKQFFTGWEEEDWDSFDTFMIECIQYYLKNGLVPYEQKNVEQKRIIAESSEDFFEYIESLGIGIRYNKAEELEKFKREYPDNEKLTQRKFTSWCKRYAKLKGWEIIETKSDSERYFVFSERKGRAA